MPLSAYARRRLVYATKSSFVGDEIADVIDAGSGTLSANARARIARECGNSNAGDYIADKIDAGTALNDHGKHHLAFMLKDRRVAREIADVLAS